METALRVDPLVRNVNEPNAVAYYQTADDIRKLITREWKLHADFRQVVIHFVAKTQMMGKGKANPEQTKGKRAEGQKPEQKKGP